MNTPGLVLVGSGMASLLLVVVGAALFWRRGGTWPVEAVGNPSLRLRWPATVGRGSSCLPWQSEPPPAIEVNGLSKAEAEEWLDWLENHGYRQCELTFVDPAGFTVRHKSSAA